MAESQAKTRIDLPYLTTYMTCNLCGYIHELRPIFMLLTFMVQHSLRSSFLLPNSKWDVLAFCGVLCQRLSERLGGCHGRILTPALGTYPPVILSHTLCSYSISVAA